MMRRIGVIGASRPTKDDSKNAYEVGVLIAKSHALLICGGLTGVMEEACRGARSAGGLTVGLLPSDDPSESNPYVDIPIPTGFGMGRNVLVVRASEVVIAIGGSTGTLSELAFALNSGKTVIGLGTWNVKKMGLEHTNLLSALSPKDAVEKAIKVLKS
jgi:hypothetical protein